MRKGILATIGAFALLIPTALLFGCSSYDRAELVNTQEIPLDKIKDIDISYVSDRITLLDHSSDQVVVKEYMSKDDPDYYADITVSEGTLRIASGKRNTMGAMFSSYVEIYLPASYQGGLSISTISGKIQSETARTLSSFHAKSTSGALKLEAVNAPSVTLNTVSGSIQCTEIMGKLRAKTTSGSIHIGRYSGEGECSSTSGGVQVVFSQLSGNFTASSMSGGIRLSVPKDSSFYVSASSTSGGVTVPNSDQVTRSKRQAEGSVGNSPAVLLKATTISGGIHIEE